MSKMIIARPFYEDCVHIVRNMREWDAQEIWALRHREDPEQLARECISLADGLAFVAGVEGEAIAFLAAVPTTPRNWIVWMFATDSWPQIALSATKFVRRKMIRAVVETGAQRAECRSIEGHTKAHRWLECLGAEREASHPHYGKGGETFHTYAWTLSSPKYPFWRRK